MQNHGAEMILGLGLIVVLTGAILFFFPSKKINRWYGYRTPRSMKTQESWTFAQRYAAVQMMIWGTIAFVLNFIYCDRFHTENEVIGIGFGSASIIGTFIIVLILTERALIRKFPKKHPE